LESRGKFFNRRVRGINWNNCKPVSPKLQWTYSGYSGSQMWIWNWI